MIYADSKEVYAEFLLSDFWVGLSRRVRRQRGRCEECGSSSGLQCHHVRYTENLFDVVPKDLRVLCRECHEKAHGIRVQVKEVISVVPRNLSEALLFRGSKQLTREEFLDYKRRFLANRKQTNRPKNHRKRTYGHGVWWPGKYEGKAPGEVRDPIVVMMEKLREERDRRKFARMQRQRLRRRRVRV